MSIHDDWDGTLTCDKCGHRINSKELDKMSEKIEWKTWKSQGELKEEIRDVIDTGAGRQYIVEFIQDEIVKKSKWTNEEIEKAIDELKEDLLIVEADPMQDLPFYKVSAWAHDALLHGTGSKSYREALGKLKEAGVYHRDMVSDGIITEDQKPAQ